MALRKNNQSDYEKFANPNKDVLGEEKDPPKKVAGEYTGPVREDKKGMKYSIAGEGSYGLENYAGNTVAKGDTIVPTKKSLISSLPKNHPVYPGKGGDDYIMGGDYSLTETKSSKKRPSGPKTYKID